MSTDSRPTLAETVAGLPMPLAQVIYRAFSAKSPSEAHGLVCSAAELALRLSTLTRVGIWLSEGVIAGPARDALEKVAHASTGHWVRILRHTDKELSERPRAALMPLSGILGKVDAERDWPGVVALAGAAHEHGLVTKERIKSVRLRGALGFFELLNDYRNKTAHGSLRQEEFYAQLVPLWFDALGEVLSCADLWGNAWLAVRLEGEGDDWLRLSGKSGLKAELPNRERAVRLVEPGHVAFIARGAVLPLHPFLSFRVSNLESEQVGVIHRIESEQNDDPDGSDHLGPLTYVDLASGGVFGDVAAREGMAHVLSEIRGRDVTVDELDDEMPGRAAPSQRTGEPSTIGGFRIDRKLGGGLTEVVYVATQLSTRAQVALKMLRAGSTLDTTAEERFQRGLVALAKCDHKHVVRVLTADLTGDPQHYAMEYVHGADLSHVARVWTTLRRHKPLTESDIADGVRAAMDPSTAESLSATSTQPATVGFYRAVAQLFADAVSGIAHLHEQKVLHRDIKPANFVLTADGKRLVLIDFGIARRIDESRALTNVDSDPVGTLRYMAPESLTGDASAVDPRADIYSLGVSLWEVMTGTRLFEARSLPELRAAHLSSAARDPRTAAKEVEAPLALIIEKALEPDRNRRYQNSLELSADLAAYAHGLPLLHAQSRSALGRWVDTVRRRPAVLASAAAVGVLVIGAGIYTWNEYAPVTEKCGAVAQTWGAPTCLPGGSGAGVIYEITSSGGKVRSMRRLDSDGELAPESAGPDKSTVVWKYEYTGDRVLRATGFGADEKPTLARKFDWRKAEQGFVANVQFRKEGAAFAEPGTDITGRILDVDAAGHVVEERFANRHRREVVKDGVKAIGYQVDADGKILETKRIRAKAEPGAN